MARPRKSGRLDPVTRALALAHARGLLNQFGKFLKPDKKTGSYIYNKKYATERGLTPYAMACVRWVIRRGRPVSPILMEAYIRTSEQPERRGPRPEDFILRNIVIGSIVDSLVIEFDLAVGRHPDYDVDSAARIISEAMHGPESLSEQQIGKIYKAVKDIPAPEDSVLIIEPKN
jgi:hypothetical protein